MEEELNLQKLVNDLEDSGAFEQAEKEAKNRLSQDPEWFNQEWTHKKRILTAFAVGVLDADPYFIGYQVPENFEKVINFVAAKIEERWKEEVVLVSLVELEGFYQFCLEQSPEALAWNEGETTFVSRYSPTPSKRDFIDLGALVRNCAIYLRTERREFRFHDRFEADLAEEIRKAELASFSEINKPQ